MEMVNGYVFLDLTKSNVYAKALKVLGTDKPVVIKEGTNAPYFVDTISLVGTNVVITKGGKTITIANDNTITNVGSIVPNIMEEIVDEQGNKRFVESDIAMYSITGVTFLYNKWSLSGTHIMFVIAGKIDSGTSLTKTSWFQIALPDYIKDKIVPIFEQDQTIEFKVVEMRKTDGSSPQNITLSLFKTIGGSIGLYNNSEAALTDDKYFRVQFDLLIDNNYSE